MTETSAGFENTHDGEKSISSGMENEKLTSTESTVSFILYDRYKKTGASLLNRSNLLMGSVVPDPFRRFSDSVPLKGHRS